MGLWYFRKGSHDFHQSSVGVDSSSRQRPFRSFRLRDLSKFHPLLHIIHLPHYIISGQAGFSANRKEKSDDAISGLCGGCGVGLNRETPNFSWVALAVCALALSIWIKVKGLRVFWILTAFPERADSALIHKRMVNLMCDLFGASNSVRSRELPRKRPACAFRLQMSFWHGLEAK
jgi:hypothetical protein